MSEHPSKTDPDDVAGLRVELASLRAELADVEGRLAAASPAPAPTATRRSLLALAGGAAAAAVAGATALTRTPALAAPPEIDFEAHNEPGVTTYHGTELDYGLTSPTAGTNYFTVYDTDQFATGASAFPAAVAGWATLNLDVGVYGMSTHGGANSIGVVGSSTTGYDVALRGGGRASFAAATTAAGPPTSGTGALGDLLRDTVGDWFVCSTPGSPGVWRKLGGPSTAGALHVINPTRVYDSRLVGGILASGGSRGVSVANGINITTGAIMSPNVVPNGATAITYNITVTQASLSGFLAVTPGDATSYSASTINWSNGTSDLANGTLVKLDDARSVKVFLGGPGTTHFLIDITGYYL